MYKLDNNPVIMIPIITINIGIINNNLFFINFWSFLRLSPTINLQLLKAVSPLVIGHITTPTIASIVPEVSRIPFAISLTELELPPKIFKAFQPSGVLTLKKLWLLEPR